MSRTSKATKNEISNDRTVFLNTNEAAKFLKLKTNTLAKMRVYGTGPKYRKHGRYVIYHIAELNEWSENHRYNTTSDV